MTRQRTIRPDPHAHVPDTAMVMAAGLGKRMRPLTATRPKPLVEVAGKPLIDHVFDRLRTAGVRRAVVNVHYLADTLEAHVTKQTAPVADSPAPSWRSVAADPPPTDIRVLVDGDGGLEVMFLTEDGDWYTNTNDYHDGDPPIWWMPLPEPPGAEEKT